MARLAGIMAAKRTGELIPLCHPLGLDSVDIDITAGSPPTALQIEATVQGSWTYRRGDGSPDGRQHRSTHDLRHV